jgi:hypothetical protein
MKSSVAILSAALWCAAWCAPGDAQTGNTTATGVSNAMNPAISVNGLFLGQWTDPDGESDGFKTQELELAMTSVVDPYFKANVYVGHEPDPTGPEAEVALEEAYVMTTSLPSGFQVRAGRFFAPFGRHNQLHTHNYPFVVPPRGVVGTLGEESAGDVGVEGSYTPLVSWFMNLRAYLGDGAVEGLYDGESRELAAGVRVENLWDLSPGTTLEGAVSVWNGPDTESMRRTFYGMDVRLKHADLRRTYGRKIEWTTELVVDSAPDRDDHIGFYTLARTRVARRWWLGGGYSLLSLVPEGSSSRSEEHEIRGQVAFAQSEFSALRIDLVWLDPAGSENELGVAVQLNFTIGSHPAHAY